MEEYVYKNHKKLRCGYTTGTCAAAAAKAAARMLLTGRRLTSICVDTPKGILATFSLLDITLSDTKAVCAVQKDAGDDADCTDKIRIYAAVSCRAGGKIVIEGGTGIGRVTRLGLEQPVGSAAINSVPRKMIKKEVLAELAAAGYEGGLEVVISAPEGMEIAKKTFNPRLGIEGGISILGTSGIVEPMSERAIVDTIRLELKQKKALGYKTLLLSPGNYGQHFASKTWGLDLDAGVKCSNFIGETLDIALELGFSQVLLIGHIGKLIKVAAGVMNTHSSMADARLETLSACALLAGADADTARCILGCTTTDDALQILTGSHILEESMTIALDKMLAHMRRRVDGGIQNGNRLNGSMQVGVILFSNVYGILAMSDNAEALMEQIKEEMQNA